MSENPTPEAVAGKLGKRQREVIIALSADWGPSGNYAAAKRLWYRQERLIDHKHRTDDCWCLTDFGLAVRQALTGESA